MLPVLATALIVICASLVAGAALLRALGREAPTWLAGAVGFAALTVAAPILIRLPGRAATTAILLALTLVAAAAFTARRGWPAGDPSEGADEGFPRAGEPPAAADEGLAHPGSAPGAADEGLASRRRRTRRRGGEPPSGGGLRRATPAVPGLVVTALVLAAASLPFFFNDRVGVLGTGIYTNDQAAQLYWTDWLQNGVGPQPNAVRVGYPTGPQALTATVAEGTGADLDDAFNGLLLAIAALTALTALAALAHLAPARRVPAAALAGLPYLGASFLAQSAFKETAMALLVLAFAVALGELARGAARRAALGALAVLAAAAVLTYSLPGLAWFGLALPLWLALEALARRRGPDLAAAREALGRHRVAIAAGLAVVAGVVLVSAGQVSSFFDRLGDIQGSPGRLSSPVFPGEALGIWPEGNFQIVRGEVGGAIPAALAGLAALAFGALVALRRRELALVALLGAAGAVYVAARLEASIYVQAKALAIMAPLVAVVALGALLARGSWARFALGAAFAAAAAGSTFLALRAAPVGFDERGSELEQIAERVGERPVAFLGVDRFAGYWLRGTLVESPGGYVPPEIRARPEKVWQQGRPMDLDTLAPNRLADFPFAITTSAAYQSSPPPGLEPLRRTGSYVLWRRAGEVAHTKVLDEKGAPGRTLDCDTARGARIASNPGWAAVMPEPVVGRAGGWSLGAPFAAPARATRRLELGPGRWELSLQYHSQAPLTVSAGGAVAATLPPSLDGMYLTHQGQGAFWPAGSVRVRGGDATRVTVGAAGAGGLRDSLGLERSVWLGEVAATRPGGAERVPLADACGRYVDHFLVSKRRGNR